MLLWNMLTGVVLTYLLCYLLIQRCVQNCPNTLVINARALGLSHSFCGWIVDVFHQDSSSTGKRQFHVR